MKVVRGLMLVAVLAACGDPVQPRPGPKPTRLGVSIPDGVAENLQLGDTVIALAFRLDEQGLPIVPDTTQFVWSSSDETVLTVDANGRVAMVGLGSADVVAHLRDWNTLGGPSTTDTASARASVTATYRIEDPGPVAAASMADEFGAQCIIRPGGQALCRGGNQYGQLGNGSTTNSTEFVPVSGGHSFASISSGNLHTCAMTADQRAFCWGRGHHGQLGDGRRTVVAITAPLEIATHRWLRLDAGGHGATCAIRSADSVAYCFGHNDFGQTGREPLVLADTVVAPIAGSAKMRSIYTSGFHTCGLTIDGAVYCSGWWGSSTNTSDPNNGSLGTGIPTRIGGTTALTAISIGYDHGCGLSATGAAYCWGENNVGQLGTGDTQSSGTLRAVLGAPAFRSIHTSTQNSCGITVDGEAWCWGSNQFSQLGRLSTLMDKSTVPIRVRTTGKLRWIQDGDRTPRFMTALTEQNQLVSWGGR